MVQLNMVNQLLLQEVISLKQQALDYSKDLEDICGTVRKLLQMNQLLNEKITSLSDIIENHVLSPKKRLLSDETTLLSRKKQQISPKQCQETLLRIDVACADNVSDINSEMPVSHAMSSDNLAAPSKTI
jgi:hypothetical protein